MPRLHTLLMALWWMCDCLKYLSFKNLAEIIIHFNLIPRELHLSPLNVNLMIAII